MKKIFLIMLPLLAVRPQSAGALELLLEANRGESGTIGYVDIERVFKEYSGTAGAREEFMAEIKKKEDALAARKTAIFTLKAEMAKLRQEREFALTLPSLMETRRSVEEAAKQPAPAPAAQEPPAAGGPAQGAQIPVSATGPAATPPVSTSTVQPAPAPQAAEPPKEAAALPAAKPPDPESIEMPGVGRIPLSHFKFSVSTSVPEIDAALARKEEELKRGEENLRGFQRQAERELLEYESHKTEILLGRIYVALKELALKEEVSVIVDKRNILFGQNAVDLTGKLLEKLEAGDI